MGIRIEKLNQKLPVYDITVENNNNFYANNILVHNCIEILQAVKAKEITAICTLSSIVLKTYVHDKKFNYALLLESVKKVVRALNNVIDINKYSTLQGERGGKEQRAIAIGVQGLADTFFLMDLDFTSDEAKVVNTNIFETIYYAALRESCDLVKNKVKEKYVHFNGSPYSKGIFQFDMWGVDATQLSGMYDWEELRRDIIKYGVCNSLVTACMPTAGSARATNSYESFEPIQSNLFNRRVIGGEFTIVNKYLITDLEKIGLWNEQLKNEIINNDGSIQKVNFLNYLSVEDKKYESKVKRIEFLLKKYRTIWEIPQKELINMATDRAIFIDQTQSMNVYFADPTVSKLTSSHFYAWEKGLKTGCYYVRTKAISTGAKHLAIDISNKAETIEERELRELNEAIQLELMKSSSKPANSDFDCFGCSS